MKKTILLGLFAAFSASASAITVPGKAVSCTRYTDSQNETCYSVDCQGSNGVCMTISGSTTTIGCECTEAGQYVSNTFDSSAADHTSIDMGGGAVRHIFTGVR